MLLRPYRSSDALGWSAEHERDVIARHKAGDAAASTTLIQHCARFLVGMACRRAPSSRHHLAIEDLFQEGAIGVLKAADRFDPSKGSRFLAYARDWIRVCMNRAIYNTGTTIRVPCNRHEAVGREKSPRDLLAKQALSLTSLDAPLGEEGGASVADAISGPVDDASELDRDVRILLHVDDALCALSERQREIVRARFLADEPETHAAIATRLGVTRQAVAAGEARALGKLGVVLKAHRDSVLALLRS